MGKSISWCVKGYPVFPFLIPNRLSISPLDTSWPHNLRGSFLNRVWEVILSEITSKGNGTLCRIFINRVETSVSMSGLGLTHCVGIVDPKAITISFGTLKKLSIKTASPCLSLEARPAFHEPGL